MQQRRDPAVAVTVKRLNSEGEPVRGERTINADQAEVVRRIFRDFARGIPPRRIAQQLNAEGIPGPGGRPWGGTTVRGHTKRGSGLVNNELYIGRLVWNRQRFIKDPSTGRRVARLNPESEWIITEVPELRIIDDATWQAVKTRQTQITTQYAGVIAGIHAANNPLNRTHRPALRALIDKVVLTPGAQRGEMHATLLGEFGTILDVTP